MFSEPAVGERFFGRVDVLDILNKRISAFEEGYRQNIAITGLSFVGKTSVLHHFLYLIKELSLIPVYVEVVKEPLKSFADKFIATLLYNTLRKMGEEVSVDMNELSDKASRLLPKTHLAIRHIYSCIDRDQLDEAYSHLLGLTSVLKGELDIPCIVIFDEFDNLESLGLKNPFLSFGKVIMVQKDTMYIVTSSRNQAVKKILSEKLSLLFGNFEIVKMGGFDVKTSCEFIDTKLAAFDASDEIKKFLIAFTDGNPFYLDRLSSRIRELGISRMSNYIDEGTLSEAISDLIYNSSGIIHQYLLNFILDLLDTKYRDRYIAILVLIANGRSKVSEISRSLKAKQGETSKHLARLMELGFLSKNGVFYRIDDPMLEFWLEFVYQRRRNTLVDSIFYRDTKVFCEEVKAYIRSFIGEFRNGLNSRIAELFNSFSNEFVEIDSKYIRLPHFTKVELKPLQGTEDEFIVASVRGKSWLAQAYDRHVDENDIISYVKESKTLNCKISNRVIMPLNGMDENAKLLAKELKVAIWDAATVNLLLDLYGKRRLVIW